MPIYTDNTSPAKRRVKSKPTVGIGSGSRYIDLYNNQNRLSAFDGALINSGSTVFVNSDETHLVEEQELLAAIIAKTITPFYIEYNGVDQYATLESFPISAFLSDFSLEFTIIPDSISTEIEGIYGQTSQNPVDSKWSSFYIHRLLSRLYIQMSIGKTSPHSGTNRIFVCWTDLGFFTSRDPVTVTVNVFENASPAVQVIKDGGSPVSLNNSPSSVGTLFNTFYAGGANGYGPYIGRFQINDEESLYFKGKLISFGIYSDTTQTTKEVYYLAANASDVSIIDSSGNGIDAVQHNSPNLVQGYKEVSILERETDDTYVEDIDHYEAWT